MRASVEWNHAMFVDHFIDDRHISRALKDLNVVVVRPGKYGQGARGLNAPLLKRAVLIRVRARTSKLGFTIRFLGGIGNLLPGWRQRGKPAIGRVHDQRRALGSDNRVSTVVPELVVGDDTARRVLQAALRRI